MGLLDGDLRQSIYDAFKGRLLAGEVRRLDPANSSALDQHGDPIDVDPTVWAVEGFFDTFSRMERAAAGVPTSTVKVCIFAQSAPAWTPRKDDMVRLGARWAQLAGGPLDIDPAGALWTLDAEQIAAPQ